MSNKQELEEELLPCPFCGQAPEWVHKVHPSGVPGLQCSECNFLIKHDRKDKTIFYWNRRKEAPATGQGMCQREIVQHILKIAAGAGSNQVFGATATKVYKAVISMENKILEYLAAPTPQGSGQGMGDFYCKERDKCGYICPEGQCDACAKSEKPDIQFPQQGQSMRDYLFFKEEFIAQSGQGMKWVKASERLPELDERVMVGWEWEGAKSVELGKLINGERFKEDKNVFVTSPDGWMWVKQPTHWMPLPEPPQQKEDTP